MAVVNFFSGLGALLNAAVAVQGLDPFIGIFVLFFPLLVIVLCAASASLTPRGSGGLQRLQAEQSFAACLRKKNKKNQKSSALQSEAGFCCEMSFVWQVFYHDCDELLHDKKKKDAWCLRAGRPGRRSLCPGSERRLSSPPVGFFSPPFPSSSSLPRHTLPSAGRLCF